MADVTPEPEGPEDDELKRKFREALERKKLAQTEANAGGRGRTPRRSTALTAPSGASAPSAARAAESSPGNRRAVRETSREPPDRPGRPGGDFREGRGLTRRRSGGARPPDRPALPRPSPPSRGLAPLSRRSSPPSRRTVSPF
nr:hypothetical protein GCM10020093_024170 [Planobispora longispora]